MVPYWHCPLWPSSEYGDAESDTFMATWVDCLPWLVCWPCLCPLFAYIPGAHCRSDDFRTRHERLPVAEWRRKKSEELSQLRSPLPRKRALSIGPDGRAPAAWLTEPVGNNLVKPRRQRTLGQEHSALLTKLPIDVRYMIWELCLGGALMHMFGTASKLYDDYLLGHFACPMQSAFVTPSGRWTGCNPAMWHCLCGWYGIDLGRMAWEHSNREPVPQTGRLALLQTCRRVYTETIPVLYGSNVFHVVDHDALSVMSHNLLPARMHAIRSIHLDLDVYDPESEPTLARCSRVRDILAPMKSLHHLWIMWNTQQSWSPGLHALLAVLAGVGAARSEERELDMRILWWALELAVLGPELPFRIEMGPSRMGPDCHYYHTFRYVMTSEARD